LAYKECHRKVVLAMDATTVVAVCALLNLMIGVINLVKKD